MSEYDFAATCLPHRHELINFARRLTGGDASRAEDVVQDSLMKALIAWPRWSPEGDVSRAARGWLYRIVSNTFTKSYHRDRVRREALHERREDLVEATCGSVDFQPRAVRGQIFLDPEHSVYGDNPGTPYLSVVRALEEIEGAMPSTEVLEAIAKLEPDHQEVVTRHYVRGHGYSRIARDLEIPRGTVTSRLHRARRALRPMLEGFAFSEYGLGCAEEVPDPVQAPQHVEPDACGVDGVVAGDHCGAFDVVEPAPYLLAAG